MKTLFERMSEAQSVTDRNTPSPDDRELIEAREIFAGFVAEEDEPGWQKNILQGRADKHPSFLKVRSLLADRAKLEERVRELEGALGHSDDLPKQLLLDADEMEACGAGNEAANMRKLVKRLLDARAALNRSADRG